MMTEILTSFGSLVPVLVLVLVTIIQKLNRVKLSISAGKFLLSGSILIGVPLLTLFYLNNLDPSTTALGLLRFDALSITMFLMVSIIGLIVLRFSESYLQGDPNHQNFIHKLLITTAFVQLLVLSGSIFTLFFSWVATSLSLQRLILFYRERKEAQQAVKKKFLIARMSDLSLFIAMLLLYFEFGSSDLETIFQGLQSISSKQLPLTLELSGLFLALAAIFKSVQIPFHGWVLDVMEAPTPVSGLLHAGLLNAGPFLIIRFSYLLDLTSAAPILLLVVGGISALYGTIVFPTQPAIKTGLAYSSIGHMGFSLMICGMGLYAASLLHLIAHSFYKAHSFLSSGSAIDQYRLQQLEKTEPTKPTITQLIAGAMGSIAIFLTIITVLGQQHFGSFQMIMLGVIIIVGLSSFMAKTATVKNGYQNIIKAILTTGFVVLAFFIFETTIRELLGNQIPVVSNPGIIIKSISIALLILFTGTIINSLISTSSQSLATSKWQIYKRNGFYVHVIFDRFMNSIQSKMNS